MTFAQVVAVETPLWVTLGVGGVVTATLGWTGQRVVKAFDAMGLKVEGFQSALLTHEGRDVERFEAIREEVRKHANIVAAPLSQVQLDLETVRIKIEAIESRLPEKRKSPR